MFHLSGNNRPGPMFTTIERAKSAVLACHRGCTEWARLLYSPVAAGAADLQSGRSHPYYQKNNRNRRGSDSFTVDPFLLSYA